MIPGGLWYIIHSHLLYVEKFLFDASHEAKYTVIMINRKLVQFTLS